MDTSLKENLVAETDGTIAGMSYVLREEEQLAQIWSEQDRVTHERNIRDSSVRLGGIRQLLERVRDQSDSIWERFVTLTLERLLSGQLREFLDQLEMEIVALGQQMVEADCQIDRLSAHIQEQRRLLEDKIAILEPIAHRTSTQTHLNMMLARVEGLERFLLGGKEESPGAIDAPQGRYTSSLPGDLLYVRIRLLTTKVAIAASTRSKQLSELDAELAAFLPEVDRYKAEVAALMTRVECMSELSRYWLAYLDIAHGQVDRT